MNFDIDINESLYHDESYPILKVVDIPLMNRSIFLNVHIQVKLWFIHKSYKFCIELK